MIQDTAKSDDHEANVERVEGLVRAHEDAIRRFIRRRSGRAILDRASVEDLYQDTVAQALQDADSLGSCDEGRFLDWIMVIARRIICRAARNGPPVVRIKGPASTGVGIPESELRSSTRTPSSITSGQERNDSLKQALRSLPTQQRIALTLSRIERRSLAEIAGVMGLPTKTVSQLIWRAAQSLREVLEDR